MVYISSKSAASSSSRGKVATAATVAPTSLNVLRQTESLAARRLRREHRSRPWRQNMSRSTSAAASATDGHSNGTIAASNSESVESPSGPQVIDTSDVVSPSAFTNEAPSASSSPNWVCLGVDSDDDISIRHDNTATSTGSSPNWVAYGSDDGMDEEDVDIFHNTPGSGNWQILGTSDDGADSPMSDSPVAAAAAPQRILVQKSRATIRSVADATAALETLTLQDSRSNSIAASSYQSAPSRQSYTTAPTSVRRQRIDTPTSTVDFHSARQGDATVAVNANRLGEHQYSPENDDKPSTCARRCPPRSLTTPPAAHERSTFRWEKATPSRTPSVASQDSFWNAPDRAISPIMAIGRREFEGNGWYQRAAHTIASSPCPQPSARIARLLERRALAARTPKILSIPQPIFSLGVGRPRPGYRPTQTRSFKIKASKIRPRVF